MLAFDEDAESFLRFLVGMVIASEVGVDRVDAEDVAGVEATMVWTVSSMSLARESLVLAKLMAFLRWLEILCKG